MAHLKGEQKKPHFFENNILALLKHLFYSLNLLGVKEKSFRDVTKENFDTCPRSEDLIITKLCHFSTQ